MSSKPAAEAEPLDADYTEIRPPAAVEPTANLPQSVPNPLDLPVEVFTQALNRRGENRRALMGWVQQALVDNVDFGRIHVAKNCPNKHSCTNKAHFSRPSLYKPGAEKICGMLGLKPTFPTLKDYENAVLNGREICQIILRCHLIDAGGQIVSDGVGARSVQQDYGDLNKALKMCAKSAHIDAVLRCAGLSEVFTQDIEDMKFGESGADPDAPPADPGAFVMPFGKHKGKTLEAIITEDPGYYDWLLDKCESEDIVPLAQAVYEKHYPPVKAQSAAPPATESAPKAAESATTPEPSRPPGGEREMAAAAGRAMATAKTIDDLQQAWADMPETRKPQFVTFYNKRKEQLS